MSPPVIRVKKSFTKKIELMKILCLFFPFFSFSSISSLRLSFYNFSLASCHHRNLSPQSPSSLLSPLSKAMLFFSSIFLFHHQNKICNKIPSNEVIPKTICVRDRHFKSKLSNLQNPQVPTYSIIISTIRMWKKSCTCSLLEEEDY